MGGGFQVKASLELLKPEWDDNPHGWPWPPRENYYEWYVLWAALMRPARILEIGVLYGWSIMAMLAGHPATQEVVLVDDGLMKVLPGEAAIRISNFRARVGHTTPLLIKPVLLNTLGVNSLPVNGKFDIIHVDGHHSPYGVWHDLELSHKYLWNDGMIIVDDLSLDSVRPGVLKWEGEHPEFRVMEVSTAQRHHLLWKEPS
jgi:predicted O-methyltransferase YrrM